jgi:hypothetical protein
MPILVPNKGTEITVVDFGKPVVDELNRITPIADGSTRQGFTRTGTNYTSQAGNTNVPLATLQESAGLAWAADGTNGQFTCPIAGVYFIFANIFAGANALPSSIYAAIQVNGVAKVRAYVYTSNNIAYGTLTPMCVVPLTVGQKVSFVVGGGAIAWLPVAWPGGATDGPAPLLSVWRVSA